MLDPGPYGRDTGNKRDIRKIAVLIAETNHDLKASEAF